MAEYEEDLGVQLGASGLGVQKSRNSNRCGSDSEDDGDLGGTIGLGLHRDDLDFGIKKSNASASNGTATGLDEISSSIGGSQAQSIASMNPLPESNTANEVPLEEPVDERFGHLKLNEDSESESESDSDGWQAMPAIASYNVYNKKGELELSPFESTTSLNKANEKKIDEKGQGDKKKTAAFSYTKVGAEEQANRTYQNSRKTDFLFDRKIMMKANNSKNSLNSVTISEPENEFYDEYEDEIEQIYDISKEKQLHVTRNLLKDDEKFAYVGAINVLTNQMCEDLALLSLCVDIKNRKKLAQRLQYSQKEIAAWKTEILSRLYKHLDISQEEIQMIEKLSLHGIKLEDLCKCLKTTQSIENPFEDELDEEDPEDDTETADKEDEQFDKENNNDHDDTIDLADNISKKDESPIDAANDTIDQEEIETPDQKIDDIVETTSEDPFNIHAPKKVIDPESLKQKNLDVDVAWTVICDLFLLFLQNSSYDSRSRTLLIRFAKVLNILKIEINEFEKRVTESLDLEQSTEDQIWNEQQHMSRRRKKSKKKKLAYVGLAMVGGSLVLGLSGGLLAPVIGAGIAAGLSTIGITGATGFLTGVGGTATVAITSTAIGANIGAQGMSKRMGSVRTFEFRPLHNNRRLSLILTISGWMIGSEDDVRLPFSTIDPIEGDLYSLHWEPEMLRSIGQTINILASEVFAQTIQQVLGATILTAFIASVQWPMALSKLGYLIDNPWSVSLDRAWSAGLILADTLISRNLGQRPITLVGFSLGSRVIISCLIELSKRKALGLIENVYIFGTPIVKKREHLVMARSVVSGRFVNGYSDRDWVLAYLFRATGGGFKTVMGIAPIDDIEGIENFNCTELVDGHMSYRKNMPKLMKAMKVSVTSEEFVEIEETIDPEEVRRQRQLFHDVDLAQKKLLEQKKGNSWIPTWMKPKKNKWQEMIIEEAAEEGKEAKNETKQAAPPAKKDGALVDHHQLMKELANIKKSMNDKKKKDDESGTQSAVQDIMDLTKPEAQVYLKPPQSPNTFSLLSAGRPILPKDEEFDKPRKVSYLFPDDI